jgi:penicillin amidase
MTRKSLSKQGRKNPLLTRFIVLIIAPIGAFIGFTLNTMYNSLPPEQGTYVTAGLQQKVSIERDKHGVTYINSKTDSDAFFALGYAHAQDRLWQLELQKRISQGRLSEIFGSVRLTQDAWMRALNFYGAAEQSWTELSQPAKDSLTAYADGINSWVESTAQLPVEFSFLDVKPEPWKPLDSLAWSKVFALNLANNMWSEVSNLALNNTSGKGHLSELLASYPETAPVTTTSAELAKLQSGIGSLLSVKQQLQDDLKIGGKHVGSNAWVVSGKHTEDGKAIMANDPHMGLQIPSIWYMADIKGDTLDITGMTLVGLPLVLFGKNQSITWAGTNLPADVQDLYFEQINPANTQQYMHQGQWRDFEVREQSIPVRADMPTALRAKREPAKIKIRYTVNGPVISDFVGDFDMPISLKWTALQAGDTTYESFFKLNYAQNWQQFTDAVKLHVAPTLNLLYADNQNNIGYAAVGKIPVRSKGEGDLPVMGSDASQTWMNYIPFDELPKSYNPEQGYIISANNKVIDSQYPYYISKEWALPARAERIEQLLNDKIKLNQPLSLDYMRQMQGDTVDLSLVSLLKTIKTFEPTTQRQQQALAMLEHWQGDMAGTEQGATIFHVWMRHLKTRLLSEDVKNYWNNQTDGGYINTFITNIAYDQLNRALTEQAEVWCPKVEQCQEAMSYALDDAIDEITKLLGSDMDDWQWQEMQATVYEHVPFSFVNIMDSLFERRVGNGGAINTINVANSDFAKSKGYEQKFGAGFRQVLVPGENSDYYYMNSTGQSGNILSPNYDDMIEPFRALEFYQLSHAEQLQPHASITLTPQS